MRSRPACLPSSLSRRFGALLLLLGAVLAASGCTAFARAVREGDELSTQRKWAEADAAYARALAVDPNDSEVRVKQRTVRKLWSAEVLQGAQALHAQGDLVGATPLLVRALELDAENDEARALLTQTLAMRVEGARKALKEGQLQAARAELDAVLAVEPGHAEARKGVDEVQTAWARRWFSTAQQLEEEGKLGNALLAYVRADQERVGATAARERAEAVRGKLRDEVAFFVLTGMAEDKVSAPDVVQRLSPGRLAALLPQEVPIRVVTEPPASRTGVKLSLTLERLLPLQTVEQGQRAQRYVVTSQAVPNPRRDEVEAAVVEQERALDNLERAHANAQRDYLRRQAEVAAARTAVAQCVERERKACREVLDLCRRAVSKEGTAPGKVPPECSDPRCGPQCQQDESTLAQRAGAAQEQERKLEAALEAAEAQRREVARSRASLMREPLTVQEPLYGEYPYDIEVHRLSVMASVTARLVDLALPDAPATPHTEDFAAVHEDVAHKGYEKVGVLADPVQLRSEQELRLEAGDKAMTAIAQRVLARFDAYRQKHVENARRGMVRPSAEDVAETAVRALLLTADKPPSDILLPLTQARGLTRPESLFGQ